MRIKDQLTGLDVDLARLLAEYLGVKILFIQMKTFDQQISSLVAGESDVIIAAMTRTVERGLEEYWYAYHLRGYRFSDDYESRLSK